MIVGIGSMLAIESGITCAYQSRGLMALGFFIIHVSGREYGVRSPDASMLANSYDAVKERIDQKGMHTVFFSRVHSANEIAVAFMDAIYGNNPEARLYFGESHDTFREAIDSAKIIWAPDGDSAFDDGSYVLQFDVDDKVRLIAFKSTPDGVGMLSDIFVSSDVYYKILCEWTDKFEREWNLSPKNPSHASH